MTKTLKSRWKLEVTFHMFKLFQDHYITCIDLIMAAYLVVFGSSTMAMPFSGNLEMLGAMFGIFGLAYGGAHAGIVIFYCYCYYCNSMISFG